MNNNPKGRARAVVAGLGLAAVFSCDGFGSCTENSQETSCTSEELLVLQERCLLNGGSFEGMTSATDLTDCGGELSYSELISVGGECKIEGSGSCSVRCVIESEEAVNELAGSWQAQIPSGQTNTLDLDTSLLGRARIHFTVGEDAYAPDFDVEVIAGQIDYVLFFEARDDAYAQWDFAADCRIDGTSLNCLGRGNWAGYPLNWVRGS